MSWLPLVGPSGGGGYTPQGVLFDSTTTASWTTKNSQFTGIVDSKVGTLSGWVFFPSTGASVNIFSQGFGSGGNQRWAYCQPDSYGGTTTEGQGLLNSPVWVAMSTRNQGIGI